MPYGIIKTMARKKYEKRNYIHYTPSLPDIEEEESRFKNIISVQGFGFSGSGAVLDFLREFPTCIVFGSVDIEGSKTKVKRHINGEIDFLRHAGGLFEIEQYLLDNNLFSKDALMKRFVRLINYCPLFEGDEAKLLVNQFYNQLIQFEIDTKGRNSYNAHTSNELFPDSNIKVMRQLSIEQYRVLCRRFLTSFFNLYHCDNSQYFVVDQLCNDFNFDYEKYIHYIPNLKTIVVYRDPRDVYAYSIKKNIAWIPHSNVEEFICWYQINKQKLDLHSPNNLVLRFEDVVFNYENESNRIIDYLGLTHKEHKNQFGCLDPQESAKNIGIWKTLADYHQDMDKISAALSECCYNGK